MQETEITYDVMPLSAPFDDFRRHILDGTAEGVSSLITGALAWQLFAQSEIRQDDMSGLVHQDIFQFDVPVDDTQL